MSDIPERLRKLAGPVRVGDARRELMLACATEIETLAARAEYLRRRLDSMSDDRNGLLRQLVERENDILEAEDRADFWRRWVLRAAGVAIATGAIALAYLGAAP